MNCLGWMRSFSWWKWVFMQIRKLIVSLFKKGDQIWFMRGSRNFRQVGGGGGPGPGWHIKKALTFFFFNFLVLNLFYRSPVIAFKENYYLPRFQWGATFSRGGGGLTFYRGIQLFFPYRNPYNLWFSRGVRTASPPPPPLDPPMWFRASWFNLSSRFSLFFFNITSANVFVERGGNVASAAVLPVV